MPGWHQYPIPEFFADRFGVRALVDNDVNAMALAEQRRAFPGTRYLLRIEVGTGIDCGIVADGRLHRGAQGSAGDIGHIRVGGPKEPCRAATRAALRRSRAARHSPAGPPCPAHRAEPHRRERGGDRRRAPDFRGPLGQCPGRGVRHVVVDLET